LFHKTYDYNPKSKRITWERYALELAKTASLRSEDPYVQVGACALDFEHKVLSLGYNGLAPGKEVENHFWDDRDERRPFMIHAEANCLALFTAGKCEILAVTLLPCSSCATLIAGYKIKKVVYQEVYKRDIKAIKIFDFYQIEHENLIV
jgi:dCMP deaminase